MSGSLKDLMAKVGLTQGDICRETGLTKGAVSHLVNFGRYNKGQQTMVSNHLQTMLKARGATAKQIAVALASHTSHTKNKTPGTPHAEGLSTSAETAPVIPSQQNQPLSKSPTEEKEDPMLLRKQTISQETKQHFKLFKDPFKYDVQEAKDVFLTPDIRYVREAMWQTVRHGGLLAVVGESGSGKSTLRADMIDRVVREQVDIVMISPQILAVEELKSAAIAQAIIRSISPLTRPARGAEARFNQLDVLLKNSSRSGSRHVMVIEEAHGLSIATLKHLKRFFEMRDGFKEMLSVILIGQPELREKLSEKNLEVREVVQRCDLVELPPLDNQLEEYLKFKLARVGIDMAAVFDKGAVDAIRSKLTSTVTSTGKTRAFGQPQQRSYVYPLAVANLVTGAMNMAVSIGAPLVTADLVMEA